MSSSTPRESEIVVEPFQIPGHYKRYAGMDVGWKTTAVCWFAEDPDTGVHYLFSDYARGSVEPVAHAQAIKSRGKWTVAIDPPSSTPIGHFARFPRFGINGINKLALLSWISCSGTFCQ